MDNRIFYPEYFYAKSTIKNSKTMVLAWKERNGYGYQSLKDVSTDGPTSYLYKTDFESHYQPCSEEESNECIKQVDVFIAERGGPQHEVPRYKYTNRDEWA